MKKHLSIILALLISVSLFSGFQLSTAKTSSNQVTVNIFDCYAGENPHGQYVYKYANAFMAKHPDIKINITAVSSNDIYTKIAVLAANPDQMPTLFFCSADAAPSYNQLGILENYNKYVDKATKALFAPGVVNSCTIDKNMVYYPVAMQPSAVIYRMDRFKQAKLEVPKTWEQFLNCAKALTKDTNGDGKIDQWGFSMVGSNNSSGQSRFLSYLWSNGLNVIKKTNGKWGTDLNSDQFLKAFTFWSDMSNKYGVVPTGITQVDYATAANYFAMGYTSMMLSGSNAIGVAYASNPKLKGKIGSFIIPGGHPGTMMNAEGYALYKKASESQKLAAVEYLRFFNNNDSLAKFWKASGKIPATLVGEKAPYLAGQDFSGYLKTIKAGCLPTITFPGMSGLKSILGNAYSAVFSKQSTEKDATTKLNKDMEQLLEDYN